MKADGKSIVAKVGLILAAFTTQDKVDYTFTVNVIKHLTTFNALSNSMHSPYVGVFTAGHLPK